MGELLEYLFEDETLTQNMDDEEAIRFYSFMITLLQELYDMGESIDLLKHKLAYLSSLVSEYGDWEKAVGEVFHGIEEV